jgi:hypothetical protein
MTPLSTVAREVGEPRNNVLDTARRLGINVSRVSALLTDKQVQKLRTHYEGKKPQPFPPRPRSTASNPPHTQPEQSMRPEDLAMYDVTEGPSIPHGCTCCGMRFPRRNTAIDPLAYCPRCHDHFQAEGESHERELARLRDHDERLRRGYARAWHCQGEYHDRMKAAFRSRDTWRAALVEVMLMHEEAEDGSCSACHEKQFPCSTWRKLDEANRGIHRSVERYGTLPEEALERELHGDD